MINKTLVFGHLNPDTDSIVSSITMSHLRNQLGEETKSCRIGKINKETAFALKTFGFDAPALIEELNENTDVILVDHNEFSQSIKGIENSNIKMVVDHHRINLTTSSPLFCISEPVGCTSTILYKLYKQHEVELTQEIAGLMLSAIISDTLLFKSPTCTKQDEEIAKKLAKIANVDLYEYGYNLLKAGTDISDYSPYEIINIDCKLFEGNNNSKFKIAQVNTADINDVFTRKSDLESAIYKEIEANNLDLFMLAVTDIVDSNSKIIALGNKSNIVEKAFEVKLDNNTALLENVVSRKTQIAPKILGNI